MDLPFSTLETVQEALNHLRKERKSRYPAEIWKAIIGLLEHHTVGELSNRLQISSSCLKRKAQQLQASDPIYFQEISTDFSTNNMVAIELQDSFGLKARIQGPAFCLECLQKLFGK